MILSRHFRSLGLATFALLAFAQVLHFVEHLEVISAVSHAHHGHSHDSPSTGASESSAEPCHLLDHSHSPAILEANSFLVGCAAVRSCIPATSTAPEAPVTEIDYPPQLI